MIEIIKNKDISSYTTFKIGSQAEFFVVLRDEGDLVEALEFARSKRLRVFVLGGGSNVLITKKIKGLVVKNEIKGIKVIRRNKNSFLVRSYSGELWSHLVNFSVDHKLYGIENLFLIPGTVGAAPIQNIGAYGVELKDVFYSLEAINIKTGKKRVFKLQDCHFNYRDSIFRGRLKNKYFIYSVSLKLQTRANFNLDYGNIKDKLQEEGIIKPKIKDVVNVIQKIRNSKIPNPVILPNAGSFFKNPIINKKKLLVIFKNYQLVPYYTLEDGRIKIPAAWLIDQAGFKGKKINGVGMYKDQPLVLVNYDQATSRQALSLAKKVKDKVKRMFDIELEEEVNII